MTPEYLIVHHSASPDSDMWLEREQIRQWHIDNGWRDIGYHFVCERVDSIYMVSLGRPMSWDGSHAPGYNNRSFGFCFIGNFSKGPPPEGLLNCGARHIAGIMDAFDIPMDNLLRHSDTKPTECPGTMFPWDDFKVKVSVLRGLT